MTRTAIIAAMPAELKPLTRGWQHRRQNGVDLWRWSFDGGEWLAACGGAGLEAGTRAFLEIEKTGPIDRAISTGWAGALREDLNPGEARDVSTVIDARTGERFVAACPPDGFCVVTSPKVADEAEKKRLASTYSAALVDMEGAVVARLAQMRGIPFYCIKAISDGYNEQLPDFNRFILPNGQFQILRFVFFAILSPRYWPALIRMGENSRKSSRAIADALFELLDRDGQIRKRNGYPDHQR